MKLGNYPAELKREALQYFRSLLFTPSNAKECYEIIESVFTEEERYAIGRRLQIAAYLLDGTPYQEIEDQLKTTSVTISRVHKRLRRNSEIFRKIIHRFEKDEEEIRKRSYDKVGASKKVFKKTVRTGFKEEELRR